MNTKFSGRERSPSSRGFCLRVAVKASRDLATLLVAIASRREDGRWRHRYTCVLILCCFVSRKKYLGANLHSFSLLGPSFCYCLHISIFHKSSGFNCSSVVEVLPHIFAMFFRLVPYTMPACIILRWLPSAPVEQCCGSGFINSGSGSSISSESGSDPGFWWPKIEIDQKLQFIYPLASIKDVQATGEAINHLYAGGRRLASLWCGAESGFATEWKAGSGAVRIRNTAF